MLDKGLVEAHLLRQPPHHLVAQHGLPRVGLHELPQRLADLQQLRLLQVHRRLGGRACGVKWSEVMWKGVGWVSVVMIEESSGSDAFHNRFDVGKLFTLVVMKGWSSSSSADQRSAGFFFRHLPKKEEMAFIHSYIH